MHVICKYVKNSARGSQRKRKCLFDGQKLASLVSALTKPKTIQHIAKQGPALGMENLEGA